MFRISSRDSFYVYAVTNKYSLPNGVETFKHAVPEQTLLEKQLLPPPSLPRNKTTASCHSQTQGESKWSSGTETASVQCQFSVGGAELPYN